MVCEWCRGTYTSGGTWEPNVNERNDGADLLAWCEHQDWIDVIGLVGHLVPVPDLLDRGGHHHAEGGLHLRQPLRHRPVRLRLPKGSFRCDVLTAWAMQNADIRSTPIT